MTQVYHTNANLTHARDRVYSLSYLLTTGQAKLRILTVAEKAVSQVNERPYELAMREMTGRAEMEKTAGGSGFDIASAVADKITSAKSIEDVIREANARNSLEDFIGKPFRFTGHLRFSPAAEQFREGGVGVYVTFDALDMNSERHTYSTGAVNVVFTLKKFETLGYFSSEDWISDKVFVVKSRPTPAGAMYTVDFA